MKRSLIGIFLFLCLIAPLASTYLYLKHQKKLVRKEIKWRIIAGIDRSELVFLKFSKEEKLLLLNWKHSKEFEFKGEMYDIVETHDRDDSTFYWVWWDHEETKLNRQLKEIVAGAFGNKDLNKESRMNLQKFFQTLFFPSSNDRPGYLAFTEIENKIHRQNLYANDGFPPPKPPPKND